MGIGNDRNTNLFSSFSFFKITFKATVVSIFCDSFPEVSSTLHFSLKDCFLRSSDLSLVLLLRVCGDQNSSEKTWQSIAQQRNNEYFFLHLCITCRRPPSICLQRNWGGLLQISCTGDVAFTEAEEQQQKQPLVLSQIPLCGLTEVCL